MPLKSFKPYTKSTRGTILVDRTELWKGKPFKALVSPKNSMKGRNNNGHITYLRTDSTRTDPSARNQARAFIESKWGTDHLGAAPGPGAASSKDSNAQD